MSVTFQSTATDSSAIFGLTFDSSIMFEKPPLRNLLHLSILLYLDFINNPCAYRKTWAIHWFSIIIAFPGCWIFLIVYLYVSLSFTKQQFQLLWVLASYNKFSFPLKRKLSLQYTSGMLATANNCVSVFTLTWPLPKTSENSRNTPIKFWWQVSVIILLCGLVHWTTVTNSNSRNLLKQKQNILYPNLCVSDVNCQTDVSWKWFMCLLQTFRYMPTKILSVGITYFFFWYKALKWAAVLTIV